MFSVTHRVFGEKNTRVVLVFGGWGMTQRQLWLLGQLFSTYNFKAIVFTWDKSILTSDIELTTKRFHQVKNEAVEIIKKLPKKEQKQLSLFGISQGAMIGMMVANTVKSVDKIIINLVGADIADIIWSWDKKKNTIRRELSQKRVKLQTLKDAWFDLSPTNNLDTLQDKRVLFYLAEKDNVIPFDQQKKLLEQMKTEGIKVEAIINTKHNHFIGGLINLLKFDTYINFLKESR